MNSKESYNFIKSTFLKLTSKTYPYGFEDDLVDEMTQLGIFKDLTKDDHGNYFLKIGQSRTVFASHLDTACKNHTPVNHVIEGSIIRTDKTTILGADDKAGVTVMLWMIKHQIPGLYYFFIGEEVGCIGSGLAAKFYETKGHFDRIISFDRRGTNSIITHQSSMRTCSDQFAKELASQLNTYRLNFKADDTGVYTDSAEFTSVIPECTNISVGYYQEHTFNEHQDIEHLYKLSQACLQVEWEKLPTKRDMTKVESKYDKWDKYDYGNYDSDGWDESWNRTYNQFSNNSRYGTTRSSTSDSRWRFPQADDDYDYGVKKRRRKSSKSRKFW
ncbi:hypothetical protein EBU71_15655, partial [bacterium]|nr:hypothetical protein [Candidatus Elulimicrobium humile]